MDILRNLGYSIRISTNYIDGDTEVVYEASTDGLTWKSFEDFIKEDVDVSHHELIRKNVVTATRYCSNSIYMLVLCHLSKSIHFRYLHQRLKAFINKILMDPNNPMCVMFYSIRSEFQNR